MESQFESVQGELNPARKRILVIEDDICLETILCRILRAVSPEVEIDWLTSADEALIKLQGGRVTPATHYDLILADIFLDGKSTGIDLWEKCQSLRPETPVLLMSGMPIDEFFRTIGRDAISPPYLPKPFTVGECGQIIDTMLRYGSRKRAHSAA